MEKNKKNDNNEENNSINNNNININNINNINIIREENKSTEDIIDIDKIIFYITSNLQSIMKNNKKMKKKPSKDVNEPFYSKSVPDLSLKKFIKRIIRYTEAENNTLLIAYLYIMKLIKKENFVLSLNNVYRLLLGSVVLAKKTIEDLFYNNAYYCDIGAMPVNELNKIELSLFVRIDYEVNIKKEELDNLYKDINNFCSSSSFYK